MTLQTTSLIASCVFALACPAFAQSFDVDGNPFSALPVRPDRVPGLPAVGVVTFNNQADFLAAAGPVATEDFEGESLVGDCGNGGVTVLPLSAFTATASTAALKILDVECSSNGNHNTTPGGEKFLNVDTDLGGVGANVMIALGAPVNALGLYFTDLDSASLEVVVNGSAYVVPPTGGGGEGYFGIIDPTLITVIQLNLLDVADSHWSMDDISYAVGPVSVEEATWGGIKAAHR